MNMKQLFALQKWLGPMIRQPLQENHLLPAISPFGTETEKEAEQNITHTSTLKPFQRVQIYHQQYWWRLVKCLQKNFPVLARLFDYEDFQNRLAGPYLSHSPPAHWALCRLGETFPQWIRSNYQEEDRYLVTTAAEIDWAAGEAFLVGALPRIDFAKLSPEETLSKTLTLQPHVYLFSLHGDFFTFREEFLKQEPEYYNSNPFPQMIYGENHFVLYRTLDNVVTWRKVSRAELWVLSQFKSGNTIERVCALLEENGGEILEEALLQIPFWFKQWTVFEWLG